ncbi:transposase [Nesterenkonia alkaliphila]|uniref:transposase n=1 Tax=Nesterenkonia alkaliphila TaxID=1463631 RepID=UPI0019B55037|nr:transposase [Nesterenkonia alkaliphila]GFZ98077.1 hypothetical protein GCM10011359_29060 [Nesterenkonia alkaliphila]
MTVVVEAALTQYSVKVTFAQRVPQKQMIASYACIKVAHSRLGFISWFQPFSLGLS